ncbi:MAG: hypothetical protein OXF60_02485 [Gammaproteobacteria bacterium]|nr:hypothetical protein [Gammaproteobacteria bacterium]
MKKKFILLFILLVGSGMISTVHACFDSLPLGHYALGGWNGPGPNSDSERWEVNGVVGSSDRYSTVAELESARDNLIAECSMKGNEIISEAEGHMIARKNTAGERFDDWCTTDPFCGAIREMTINNEHNQLDNEISRMKAWYTDNIMTSQANYREAFDELSPYLCTTTN